MLSRIPRLTNANVLVGFDTSDDAGVYQLTPSLALVQTVDFFTPIVDDPYTFGAIAAANALSDVYAMGGTPLSALSILAYPDQGDLDDLEAILRGGGDKLKEAGCVLLGGHSVRDDEIKFGYAINGTLDGFADVVELQVEEDLLAFANQLANKVHAGGGVEFHTDFIKAARAAEVFDEIAGLRGIFDV